MNTKPESTELACAKVNLTLRVLGRRSDGYHELESLVAFADIGDMVAIRTEPEAGRSDRFTVSGPFAGSIVGENLLGKAMAMLRAACPELAAAASVHLDKRLPVAAGLGGGSADAAALLRVVRRLNPGLADGIPWMEIAARLGSDVPVCLASRPALMLGRGERVVPVPALPDIPIVLVNPRVPLSTAAVFKALQARPAPQGVPGPPAPSFSGVAEVLDYMRAHGNDMEAAALGLLPAIGEVKTRLAAEPGCLHAAMSGSGPTCFGIFASKAEACSAAVRLAAVRPGWWVEPGRLLGT